MEQIPWWRTDLGDDEIQGVAQSIRSRHINQGPVCAELERRLADRLDVPYVALTTSGSTALLAALMACGVRPGDEVIVPALSFIATAHAPLILGAKIVLVDVLADVPLMDVSQVERAISDKTKVILPVHLNGRECDMASLVEIAAKHQLKIVEDSAQAFCSRNHQQSLGAQGDMGTFSMSLTKLITTGEGGFVATRNEENYRILMKLRNQGVDKIADNVFDDFGFNLRFNDMLAGMGLAQMDKLDEKIAGVRRVYQYYRDQLADLSYLKILEMDLDEGQLPLWTQVLCSQRDEVIARLNERGIQARPFHPSLAQSQHLFSSEQFSTGQFPRAEFFASHIVTLPSGPDQRDEDLARTAEALREIGKEFPAEFHSLTSK